MFKLESQVGSCKETRKETTTKKKAKSQKGQEPETHEAPSLCAQAGKPSAPSSRREVGIKADSCGRTKSTSNQSVIELSGCPVLRVISKSGQRAMGFSLLWGGGFICSSAACASAESTVFAGPFFRKPKFADG